MSELKQTLTNQVRQAMRAGDKERRDTLRQLLAAIKQVEVDDQTTLDDEQIQTLLQKEAKKRQEAVADFERAGRPKAGAAEKVELAIIQEFLPAQATEDEITTRAQAMVAELDVSGPRAIGQVMKPLMDEFKGRADGKLVNQIVKKLLIG